MILDGQIGNYAGLKVMEVRELDRWQCVVIDPSWILTGDQHLLYVCLDVKAMVQDKIKALAAWAGVPA